METSKTKIFGLTDNPYFLGNYNYWAMDIIFQRNYSKKINNIIGFFLGESMNEANNTLQTIHENFEKANIHEGDDVFIDFDSAGYVQKISKAVENEKMYICVEDNLSLKYV